MNEFRHALRGHLRQRAFALTVVCTLALTIAATTAVFSVVNSVLLRELPFASSDRLVWIASMRPDNPNAPFSLPEFMDYRGQTRSLVGLAAYANWSASLAEDGVTERLTGARASANMFDVLGVLPSAGRLLTDRDDRPDAPRVVVLSHRLWLRQYGGAPDAVGKTARINGESFTIVGVLPQQFPLPLLDIDVVTALVPDRDPLRYVRNSVNFLRFIGRLNPTSDAGQAQSELTAICGRLRQQFPLEYARKEAVRVTALREALVGDFRASMLLLFAAVVVVLVAALANLVSLALVRANGRRVELSIRIAMGVGRGQLARQLTVEAALLAFVGGTLGWVIAMQFIGAAVRLVPASIPRLSEVRPDGTVVAFVAVVTVLATALLTAASFSVMARLRACDALRAAGRGAIGDLWTHRVRNVLVVGEISAALVLLLATIMLVQNLIRLDAVPLGFDPDRVFQARVSIPPTYRSPDDVARFYDRLSEQLLAAPGVEQVGVISVAPLSGLLSTVPFWVADTPLAERDRPTANLRAISSGYLPAVGTRLVRGRVFSEDDRSNTSPVALVSSALADRFLSGHAVGRRLMIDDNNAGPRPVEIVGVVENVRQIGLDLPPALDVYVPLRQVHPDVIRFLRDTQFWMVKTHADPAAFRTTFLADLRAVDPDAAVAGTGTMRQYLDVWLGPRRFNLRLFGAFGLTAVLLAVSGVYGLVSYSVTQRRREFGVRMAIGASARDVRAMILRQALALGTTGALFGVGVAIAVRPFMAGLVRDVGIGLTPVAASAAALIVVVLMAAWVPARRAAHIAPTVALRGE